MVYRITDDAKKAYLQARKGDAKAGKSLYVREMKTKSGGYEYKVDTTSHPLLTKILHVFKRISTKYYHGDDAVKRIQEKHLISEKPPRVSIPFSPNDLPLNEKPPQARVPLLSGKIKKATNIPKGWKLESYTTVGDGSCGMHALLGEWDEKKKEFRCDATKARKQYADSLRAKIEENKENKAPYSTGLPERFLLGLQECYFNYANLPNDLEKDKKFMAARKQLKPTQYKNLDHSVQDGLKDVWKNDEVVLNAYINFLEKPSNWLLQDELLAFGEYFGKTVYLVQQGWGASKKMIMGLDEPLTQGTGEPVYIWYVPNTHFERADYFKAQS